MTQREKIFIAQGACLLAGYLTNGAKLDHAIEAIYKVFGVPSDNPAERGEVEPYIDQVSAVLVNLEEKNPLC